MADTGSAELQPCVPTTNEAPQQQVYVRIEACIVHVFIEVSARALHRLNPLLTKVDTQQSSAEHRPKNRFKCALSDIRRCSITKQVF